MLPTPCALQGCLCRNALPWSLSCRLNSSHKSKAALRCCCPLLPAAQAARCLLTGTVGDQFKPSLLRAAAAARAQGLCCGCFAIAVTLVIVNRSKPTGARQLPHCSFPVSAHVLHVAKVAFHGRFGLSLVVQLLQEGLAWRGVHHCAGAATAACKGLRPTISCPRGLTTTFRHRAAHILDSVFHRLGDKLNHTLDAVFFHAVCSLSFLGGISTVV